MNQNEEVIPLKGRMATVQFKPRNTPSGIVSDSDIVGRIVGIATLGTESFLGIERTEGVVNVPIKSIGRLIYEKLTPSAARAVALTVTETFKDFTVGWKPTEAAAPTPAVRAETAREKLRRLILAPERQQKMLAARLATYARRRALKAKALREKPPARPASISQRLLEALARGPVLGGSGIAKAANGSRKGACDAARKLKRAGKVKMEAVYDPTGRPATRYSLVGSAA